MKFTAGFVLFMLTFIVISLSNLNSTNLVFADGAQAISVEIDGIPQQYEQLPLLVNGHTLVPMRSIFEALGANLIWDDSTKTIVATKDKVKITLTIGVDYVYVNEQIEKMDQQAVMINGHTMVP